MPRDLLLREADHRIRNSLQLVASVLEVQARQNAENRLLCVELMQASQRVRAVAKVHEHLRSCSGSVEAGCYLTNLCADLSRSLAQSLRQDIEVHVEKVELSTEHAVALGLIVNEFVTNALKHGKQTDGGGRIHVTLSRGYDGILHLCVADGGAGLPDDFDPASRSGLGMLIVHQLVKTLSGRLEIDGRPPGARFTLHFPAARSVRGKSVPTRRSDESCA